MGFAAVSSLPLFEADIVAEREPPPRSARSYLRDIMRLRAAPERRAALLAITDAKTRAAVRFYLEDYFARRNGRALPNLAQIEAEEGARTQEETPCNPSLR